MFHCRYSIIVKFQSANFLVKMYSYTFVFGMDDQISRLSISINVRRIEVVFFLARFTEICSISGLCLYGLE